MRFWITFTSLMFLFGTILGGCSPIANNSNGADDLGTTRSTEGQNIPESTTDPSVSEEETSQNQPVEISLAVYGKESNDGWTEFRGYLVFYNPNSYMIELLLPEFTVCEEENCFIETTESNKYPVDIKLLTDEGTWVRPPRNMSYEIPPKTPLIYLKCDVAYYLVGGNCGFSVSYRIPETLHFNSMIVTNYFENDNEKLDFSIEELSLYKVSQTKSLPVSSYIIGGVQYDIQDGFEQKEYPTDPPQTTSCLSAHVKNLDLTADANLPHFNHYLLLRDKEYEIEFRGLNTFSFNLYPSESKIGPGQEKDIRLCVHPKDNEKVLSWINTGSLMQLSISIDSEGELFTISN